MLKIVKEKNFFEVLGHFKNYLGAEIAAKALGFISIPIMTRILLPSDYGIISVFSSYTSIFSILLTLNLHVAVGRYAYEGTSDFNQFFSTIVVFLAGVLLISFSAILFFQHKIACFLDIPQPLIVYFIPITLYSVIASLFTMVYQPLKKSKSISITTILNAYLGFALSVFFVYFLKKGYIGVIWGSVIISAFVSIYWLIKIRPYFKFSFKISALRYTLGYSIPLIPYALSSIILSQFDRIMINSYKGSTDAGLYSFAYNIGMLLAVFHSALNTAWIPYYYQYMREKNYEQHDSSVIKILKMVIIAGAFLIFFGKEIAMFLAKSDFYDALDAIPPVVIGYIFYSIYNMYSRNLEFAKKTIYSSAIVLIAGILNIFLNAIFIPRYGIIAAAYSTTISYFLMAVLAWIVSKFLFNIHSVPLKNIFKDYLLLLIAILIFYLLEKTAILFVYFLVVKIFLWGILCVFLLKPYLRLLFLKSD